MSYDVKRSMQRGISYKIERRAGDDFKDFPIEAPP